MHTLPTSRSGIAALTSWSSGPYVSEEERCLLHRVRARSLGGQGSADLRLPRHLDAFAAAGSPEPPIADLASRFPPGTPWTDVLTTSVVHRPFLLWSTYKPHTSSQYRSVHDLWKHWTTGVEERETASLGTRARLPPLEFLEQRFGEDWWMVPGGKSRADVTVRPCPVSLPLSSGSSS